jgi:hypothetical protein
MEKDAVNTTFDLTGQVCYVLVKLEMLHKELKELNANSDLSGVHEKLWSAEDYLKGIRGRLYAQLETHSTKETNP